MASSILEIPDSQDSNSSKEYTTATSQDDRIAFQTALQFGIPISQIQDVLKVSTSQICYARTHPLTPQKSQAGHKPGIQTPQCQTLETWLLYSPSHCQMAYKQIPFCLPELSSFGNQAITTAMCSMGYKRRTAPQKGFSEDPLVMREHKAFAMEAITWDQKRLYC
jgi:hypothetical protein